MEYFLAIVALLVCIIYIVLIVKSKEENKPTIGILFATNVIVFAVIFYINYSRKHTVEIKDWENLLKL